MHTAALIILLVLTLTLQSAVMPRADVWGVRPDAVLVLALFVAMHARRPMSYWGGAVVGAACDVVSVERAGLFTLTYGLAGLLVATIREYLFIYNVLVQAAVALLIGAAVQSSWLAYRLAVFPLALGGLGFESWHILKGAALTALLVPPAHYVLLKLSRWMGLPAPRYRATRWR